MWIWCLILVDLFWFLHFHFTWFVLFWHLILIVFVIFWHLILIVFVIFWLFISVDLWYFDFSPSRWPVSIRQLSHSCTETLLQLQLHTNAIWLKSRQHKCNMVEIKITQMQYGWNQDKHKCNTFKIKITQIPYK